MTIKNISGATARFALGRNCFVTLANNATAVVPSTPEVVEDALRLQAAGDLAVTEAESGAEVVQVQPSPQHVLVKIGDMKAATAASVTLTSNNTNVSDADTVTIGAKTYTFKTALTPTEGEVLIGADADASLLNLIRAINHTGTPDTDYKCAAAHTTVSAAAAVTTHAFLITALTAGAAGNSLASTEVAATLSFGSATLLGGIDDNGDAKYLTLSTEVFEFDSDATYTAGRTPVTIHATDQLNTGNSLKTAINANAVLAALGVVATDVLKVSTTEVYVVVLVPIAITLSSFTATASAVPLVATKVDEVLNNAQRVFCRQFTATGTSLHVVTGLTTIRSHAVRVRDAGGGLLLYDGNIVVSGGSIRLTNEGTPGVALANTNVVTVLAIGE